MFSLSDLASKKLHFIGIGGAGMSGLARIAMSHGAQVSGSDEKDSSVLAALAALGATVFASHKADHINGEEENYPETTLSIYAVLVCIRNSKAEGSGCWNCSNACACMMRPYSLGSMTKK